MPHVLWQLRDTMSLAADVLLMICKGCQHQLFEHNLQGPLQHDMLRCLPVSSLAYLRSSCCMFQELVDKHSGWTWGKAVKPILAAQALPFAKGGQAIQTRLRLHAALLSYI